MESLFTQSCRPVVKAQHMLHSGRLPRTPSMNPCVKLLTLRSRASSALNSRFNRSAAARICWCINSLWHSCHAMAWRIRGTSNGTCPGVLLLLLLLSLLLGWRPSLLKAAAMGSCNCCCSRSWLLSCTVAASRLAGLAASARSRLRL